jgi:hypothetical protein
MGMAFGRDLKIDLAYAWTGVPIAAPLEVK